MSTKSMPTAASQAAQTTPSPHEQIMQLATGFMPAAALNVVTRLGIADLIHGGTKQISALARATSTNEDALYRVMRLLSSMGIFAESAGREFSLTPASELLRPDAADSMHGMVAFLGDTFHYQNYGEMMHSVRTGQTTVRKLYGMDGFEYFDRNPEQLRSFQAAMTSQTISQTPTILEAYDFTRFHTIVDIAGGHGYLLTAVLKKYSHLHGILFDRQSVIDVAREKLKSDSARARCELVAGDFFQSVPEGGDCYMMKHIIHDWQDEESTKILRNCRRAIKNDDARVLIIDFVVPESSEPHISKLADIEMLLLPGGRERTAQEFSKLLSNSGFRLANIVPTKSGLSVVEGAPE